jgi:Outer membrane receptor proteins, mostly Fe transport
MEFLLGGRLDKHNMVDHVIFSPRANLRYNPTENMNLRASYSFGFRAPQAFDEDLHIENVGGTVSMIELAKDLTEEKSQSLSISGDLYHRWGDFQGNLLIEGFYTSLSDVFALRQIGERDGIIINERYNEKGAKVYGLTLEGKIAYVPYFNCRPALPCRRPNTSRHVHGVMMKRFRWRKKCSVLRILMDISLCHTTLSYR